MPSILATFFHEGKSYADACPENFELKEPDPTNWSRTQRICVPSEDYQGPCWSEVDFSNRSVAQLQEWAKKCGTRWKCDQHCERNIPSLCPEGWNFIGQGVCIAPSDYRGPCPLAGDFAGWTPCQKSLYARKCGVRWPCDPNAVDAVERNWSAPCPEKWTLEKPDCVAPPDDVPVCGITRINMAGWNVAKKKKFAEECDLRWASYANGNKPKPKPKITVPAPSRVYTL